MTASATQEERQGSRFDVAGRYARALFELAADDAQLPRADQDITALRKMMAESSDLVRALSDRTLEADALARALDELLVRAGCGQMVRNFVGLVVHHGRAAQLAQIISQFAALMAAHQAIVPIHVATAHELNSEQMERLSSICRAHFGDQARIKIRLDPDLIGGMTLETAGNMFDASIIGKLAQLEKNFKQAFLTN